MFASEKNFVDVDYTMYHVSLIPRLFKSFYNYNANYFGNKI